jgi:ABC-type glutathione transport system ATPase component
MIIEIRLPRISRIRAGLACNKSTVPNCIRLASKSTPAVRGVSFQLGQEKLAIVGESGSGKSTVGRAHRDPFAADFTHPGRAGV